MIDRETLTSLQPELIRPVMEAISLLADSGVLAAQKTFDLQRLTNGSADATADDLANDVLHYRRKVLALDSLQLLGEELQKELES